MLKIVIIFVNQEEFASIEILISEDVQNTESTENTTFNSPIIWDWILILNQISAVVITYTVHSIQSIRAAGL